MGENNNNLIIAGLFGFLIIVLFSLVIMFMKQQGASRHFNKPDMQMQPQQPQFDQGPPPQQEQPNVIVVPPPNCPHHYIDEHRNLYNRGYDDGVHGHRVDPVFRDSIHYMAGYRDGARYFPGIGFHIRIR